MIYLHHSWVMLLGGLGCQLWQTSAPHSRSESLWEISLNQD